MYGATDSPERNSAFPDDELRRLLGHLVRAIGLLEPDQAGHGHGGVNASRSELFALGELSDAGPLSQNDLGARLGLEKSTVSRLAAGLQERGWLIRERQPDDRRLYRLSLTEEGWKVARRIGDHLRSAHTLLLGQLTDDERQGLRVGLAGLIRALEAHHGAVHRHLPPAD